MRVLLVEDNRRLAELMRQSLDAADFAVDVAANAETFRDLALSGDHALYVIDLGLPDGDGIDLVRMLRVRAQRIPILVVTGRAAVSQRVAGLEQGADDYLVKPFHTAELIARVRALLRRPAQVEGPVLRTGGLELDPTTGEIRCGGEAIHVRRSERRLLAMMMRRPGRLVTKAMIERALADDNHDLTPNAIEQIISRLRKTLNDLPARSTIRTLRGAGYVLDELQ